MSNETRVAFQDWLPGNCTANINHPGTDLQMVQEAGGHQRLLIEVEGQGTAEVLVATATGHFPLKARHPNIQLDHELWLSCEGLPTSYEADFELTFAMDPHNWRVSVNYDPDVPNWPGHHPSTDQRHILVPRRDLASSNPKFKIGISVDSVSSLPVLEQLGRGYSPRLAGLTILVVPHLLSDFPHFAQSLVKAGASVDDIYIIGIPYSARPDVIQQVQSMGFPEVHVPNEYSEMHAEIDSALAWLRTKHLAKQADGRPFRWVVIEDGGYIVPALHVGNAVETYQSLADLRECCLGAVEQTRNGIWMYQDKVEPGQRTIPVISVAESRIKLELESRWIGETVCNNVLDLIDRTQPRARVHGQAALVVGAGATGCQIAERLQNNFQVEVFDTSPLARAIARARRLSVVDPSATLSQAVRDRSLIVAATGRENVIGIDQVRNMNDGTFVVNASSKRMEINWGDLNALDAPQQMGPSKVYYLPHPGGGRGKNIFFLAEGYPVNFYTGNSVLARSIEVIMACLFRAAVECVLDSDRPEGERKFRLQAPGQTVAQDERAILGFPEELQDEIAGIWEQFLKA